MSWRHRIGLVLLIVLTAVPVSGTVCAVLCDSEAATRAAAHHGSGKPCDDEQAAPSSGPQMSAAAGYDCGAQDAATRAAATTTATRAKSVPGPSLLAAVPVRDAISRLADSDVRFDYRSPPGSAPPTAFPLVLRV